MALESFQALRDEVARDLRPVRPLRLGRWLFVVLAILTALPLAFWWERHGLRPDHQVLGPFWLWGLSAAEAAAAAVLIAFDVRCVTPGRGPSQAAFLAAVSGFVGLQLGSVWLTYLKSPVPVPAGKEWDAMVYCLGVEALIGLPLLLAALALLRRGMVASTRKIGLAGGVGAGLAADAVWRLICPYSAPDHALAAHSGGVALVAAAGLVVAVAWDRARLAAWRTRRLSLRA